VIEEADVLLERQTEGAPGPPRARQGRLQGAHQEGIGDQAREARHERAGAEGGQDQDREGSSLDAGADAGGAIQLAANDYIRALPCQPTC
jgi:hypothetical protein